MTYRLIGQCAAIAAAGFAFGLLVRFLGLAMEVDFAQWLIAAGVGYVVGAASS